ncbi:hypothetical protein BOTBODRAFT_48829 [Botryobasidium botryosum FD-172 SS1]|uniref:Uncharacterized protein n=1 Tax=Botryobasidium botryosum (strain FD-172 SS1) TaxID=930990 RepID=A0A067LW69_BOTB1|nr:hypothetical protein BOTBODRAFT_48829 [Botryobasidium botryosum FD-172 SS1]
MAQGFCPRSQQPSPDKTTEKLQGLSLSSHKTSLSGPDVNSPTKPPATPAPSSAPTLITALPLQDTAALRTNSFSTSLAYSVHRDFKIERSERDSCIVPKISLLFDEVYVFGNCDLVLMVHRPETGEVKQYYSASILNDPTARGHCEPHLGIFQSVAAHRRRRYLEKHDIKACRVQVPTAPARSQAKAGPSTATKPLVMPAVYSSENSGDFPAEVTEFFQEEDIAGTLQYRRDTAAVRKELAALDVTDEDRRKLHTQLLLAMQRIEAELGYIAISGTHALQPRPSSE